jgi:hypothetical protein
VITEGRRHEVTVARTLTFPPGAILVIDRGYVDFAWFADLIRQGVFFVTRLKDNAVYAVLGTRDVPARGPVVRDELITLTGVRTAAKCPYPLRVVEVTDPETGDPLVFLTNQLTFGPTTIARIYKDRWQIELLFKALKQHLKVKTFVGTSANALHIQLWTALIALLVLKYLRLVPVQSRGAPPVPALHPPGPLGVVERAVHRPACDRAGARAARPGGGVSWPADRGAWSGEKAQLVQNPVKTPGVSG